MAIKLDLPGKLNEEKVTASKPKEVKTDEPKTARPKQKIASSKKSGQGRPKGSPAVTRSLRIKTNINDRLIKQHESSGLSFNELINRALDAYLD